MKKTSTVPGVVQGSQTSTGLSVGLGPLEYTVTPREQIIPPPLPQYLGGYAVVTATKLDATTISALDHLLTMIRAHGYAVSDLELEGLKLKLHNAPEDALSTAERITMRKASEDSYGARTARFLGVSDDEPR